MKSRTRLRALFGQVVRFAFVGVLAAVVDYGLLSLINHLGGSRYVARIFSVAVAMVTTWALIMTLSFATAEPPSWREFFTLHRRRRLGSRCSNLW